MGAGFDKSRRVLACGAMDDGCLNSAAARSQRSELWFENPGKPFPRCERAVHRMARIKAAGASLPA
jgi:hypothetical protein